MIDLKPNILLILIDSLRADHCYGVSKKCPTPNLDNMIKNGIYFDNAFSSSDYTVTGYGSIFTGLYPYNAGRKGVSYHKLFSKVPNYVTQLKNHGYHTYATIDSDLLKFGFSDYFENDDMGYDRTSTGLFEGLEEKIIEKVNSNIEEPWFYFIHLDDLHIPIRLPEQFVHKKYSERYEFVVEKVDSFLGNICKKIDLEKTLVIFTADHGDYILSVDDGKKRTISNTIKSKIRTKIPNSSYDFVASIKRNSQRKIRYAKTKTSLEKRSIDTRTAKNRFLFDDLVHIPLLFYGFGIPEIGISAKLAKSVDIFPTISEMIGISNVQKNIDGRSLVPVLKNEKFVETPIYLENTIFVTDEESPLPCVGLRTNEFKYFRSLENVNENVHLYDLKTDPLEEQNIADTNPSLVAKMEEILIKMRKEFDQKFEEPEVSSEEEQKIADELKKLGYI